MASTGVLGWWCVLGALLLAVYGGIALGLREDPDDASEQFLTRLDAWGAARDAFAGLNIAAAVGNGSAQLLTWHRRAHSVQNRVWASGYYAHTFPHDAWAPRATVAGGHDHDELLLAFTLDTTSDAGVVDTIAAPARRERAGSAAVTLRSVRLLLSAVGDGGWRIDEVTRGYTSQQEGGGGGGVPLTIEVYSDADPYTHFSITQRASINRYNAQKRYGATLVGFGVGGFGAALILAGLAVLLFGFTGKEDEGRAKAVTARPVLPLGPAPQKGSGTQQLVSPPSAAVAAAPVAVSPGLKHSPASPTATASALSSPALSAGGLQHPQPQPQPQPQRPDLAGYPQRSPAGSPSSMRQRLNAAPNTDATRTKHVAFAAKEGQPPPSSGAPMGGSSSSARRTSGVTGVPQVESVVLPTPPTGILTPTSPATPTSPSPTTEVIPGSEEHPALTVTSTFRERVRPWQLAPSDTVVRRGAPVANGAGAEAKAIGPGDLVIDSTADEDMLSCEPGTLVDDDDDDDDDDAASSPGVTPKTASRRLSFSGR